MNKVKPWECSSDTGWMAGGMRFHTKVSREDSRAFLLGPVPWARGRNYEALVR